MVSCSPKNIDMENREEIAMATQRLGEELYRSGNHTAALKSLLEAQKTIPDSPYLYNSLGLVYLAKHRYDLAEKSFKEALRIKSDYARAKNNLGAAYMKQEKWDLAITHFKAVSENLLYATPEIPISNIGWAYFHQKMYRKAKIYFKQSLDIRPNFLNAAHGLASVHIETGYYTQAIDFLKHALEKNPGAAIIHSDLATVYEALKDIKNAKRYWGTVLKLEPANSPLAKEAQKRLLDLN